MTTDPRHPPAARPGGTLTLLAVERARHALFLRFGFEELRFSTTYWHQDVDFHALAAAHSAEAVERLAFHVALFEANKICSLRPARFDLGPYARFLTPELEALWRTVFRNVWAQWRYENDDPDYFGPAFTREPAPGPAPLRSRARAEVETLAFCGGGKDSLATMRLLEAAGISYDTFVYSSSIYGPAQAQHALVDALVERCAPRARRRQWIFDDFLDSPVLRLHPELRVGALTAAETPAAVFGALPLALQHGYRSACLGHERSADAGQLTWPRTGESVNHQWGKSREAEALLDAYIRAALIEGFACFSPLKPVHDVVIFGLLRRHPGDVPFTHSCNRRKPWCLRCPKCLYVWLGCAAFLPREVVRATFGTDALLADEALAPGFRALLGTGGRQPFECIGRPDEVRLYLAACAARGYAGPAVDLWRSLDVAPADLLALVERYASVDFDGTAVPADLRRRLAPQLEEAARAAALYLRRLLRGEAGERP
jgi:hypothetical protein